MYCLKYTIQKLETVRVEIDDFTSPDYIYLILKSAELKKKTILFNVDLKRI